MFVGVAYSKNGGDRRDSPLAPPRATRRYAVRTRSSRSLSGRGSFGLVASSQRQPPVNGARNPIPRTVAPPKSHRIVPKVQISHASPPLSWESQSYRLQVVPKPRTGKVGRLRRPGERSGQRARAGRDSLRYLSGGHISSDGPPAGYRPKGGIDDRSCVVKGLRDCCREERLKQDQHG
jgi:hypothetical protein